MTWGTDAIFNAALSLPPESRAILAEKLLESLEEKDRIGIDAAWAQEAETRLRVYEQRGLKAIPGAEVLQFLPLGKNQ